MCGGGVGVDPGNFGGRGGMCVRGEDSGDAVGGRGGEGGENSVEGRCVCVCGWGEGADCNYMVKTKLLSCRLLLGPT